MVLWFAWAAGSLGCLVRVRGADAETLGALVNAIKVSMPRETPKGGGSRKVLYASVC